MLAVVPQGGVWQPSRSGHGRVSVTRDDAGTLTAMFAGQVAGGPVEVDVKCSGEAARCRSSPPPSATPGPRPGLTAIAAFGARAAGSSSPSSSCPRPGPRACALPRPRPDGSSSSSTDPCAVLGGDHRGASGDRTRPRGEPFEDGPARRRLVPLDDRRPGRRQPRLPSAIVVVATPCPARSARSWARSGPWFAPASTTRSTFQPARRRGSSPTTRPPRRRRLRQRRRRPLGPIGPHLVAYATQVMLFTFPRDRVRHDFPRAERRAQTLGQAVGWRRSRR